MSLLRPLLPALRLTCEMALSGLCLAMVSAPASAQTSVQIHDIMVAGSDPIIGTAATQTLPYSPYFGDSVSVSGIVVGVMTNGTIYISEPSNDWDSLILTAEGMPVFPVSGVTDTCGVVGNVVTVVGTVMQTAQTVAVDTVGTGITPTSCTVTSTGGTMTQSISVGSVLAQFGDAFKYTGMTTTATFYAVAPTTGTLTESTETESSTGQFWATLASNTSTDNHIFRSAGIAGDEFIPATAPSTVETWGGNPQRVLIDTTTFGGSAIDITVGQSISCTTGTNITVGATKGIGLIDYTLGYARLLIFPTSVCTVGGTVATSTSAPADSTHFHVGTLDLNRFYSTTGATSGSVVVNSAAYTRRLTKAALAVVNALGAPDILSLQEIQDLPTLTDLATAVASLGGTSYTPSLVEGNDPNSLNLGFLVNSATVLTDSVTQVEKTSTYTNASGASATLWERPPLVLKAEFVRVGKNYPVTVIDAHLTPRDNIGDAALGPDVRAHRAAQATDLSALIQAYQSAGQNVVLAGNLNSFEFSDGYVDVTGILDGSPAAAAAVTLYEPTSTTAALTDFPTQVTAPSRYNYIERGNAEVLEHIMASATVPDTSTASASLASYVSEVTQPHFTADFDAVDANESTTPAGLTPHDGFVVAFTIPPVPTTASISSSAVNFGSVYLGSSATQTVTITNTTTFTSTVNVTGVAISGTNASDFTQTNNCSALAESAICTITLTFAPTAVGVRNGLLTVTTDSTSNPTLSATLTGIGVTALSVSPTSLSFGNIDIGSSSAAQTVTLTNYTNASTALNSIAVTGDYADTSACGSALAALSSCIISVVFTPTATGVRTGTLTITSGDSVLTVALTGNGVDFTIAINPTSGSVIAGDSVVPNVILTPVGGFAAPVTLTCVNSTSGSTCKPSSTSVTLDATAAIPTTITTTSQYTVIGYGGLGLNPWMILVALLSGGIIFRASRRTLFRVVALIVVLEALGAANLGCSGRDPSTNADPTYPGTYTYTLSATDGTLTHSATYTLTVAAK